MGPRMGVVRPHNAFLGCGSQDGRPSGICKDIHCSMAVDLEFADLTAKSTIVLSEGLARNLIGAPPFL